jgi:hypothetical protein
MKELLSGTVSVIESSNEAGSKFYDPNIHYNYIFCASGTCYGAIMWVGMDIANPAELLGPAGNTNHTGNVVGFLNNHSATDDLSREGGFLRRARWVGNANFGNAFWIVSGDPKTYPYFPSLGEDLDGDKDVDGNDFLKFSLCYNGSLRPPQSGCGNPAADLDGDNDVDGFDFTTWSLCHNGSLKRPQAACMPPILTGCP